MPLLVHRALSPIYFNNPGFRYYFGEEKLDYRDYTYDIEYKRWFT